MEVISLYLFISYTSFIVQLGFKLNNKIQHKEAKILGFTRDRKTNLKGRKVKGDIFMT